MLTEEAAKLGEARPGINARAGPDLGSGSVLRNDG
jgi:hypothetical protein